MAAFPRQEAMEVDEDPERECTPDEVLRIFSENNLNCSFRVLGNQLGLQPYDLNILEHSNQLEDLLGRILQKCSKRELLSWTKLVSVLRKPALKQYRVANKICRMFNLSRSSRSDSAGSSMQSSDSLSRDGSLSMVDPEDEPEIPDIVNEIAEVGFQWERLGLMLGLSMNDVDTIRSSYRQDEHHQRLAELWHSRGNDCTWSNLLTVLDRLYPRRKSSVSVTSPLPETYDVEAEIKRFECQFKELIIEARQELEEKYNSRCVRVVKDELTYLPNSIVMEYQKFVTKLNSRKKEFSNLTQMFRYLNLYCWNFFDYNALENLIESKCSDELKWKMKQYNKDIEGFRQRTTITDFIKCSKLRIKSRTIPRRFIDVTIEHAIDPDVCTLADLDHFRKDTYRALHLKLSECAFQVFTIKRGCVIVEWMVPEDFEKPLKDLFYTESGLDLLQKHEVERVSINDEELPIQSLFLVTAAKKGDFTRVQCVLENKRVDINYQELPEQWTALHTAAAQGHVEIVELLLKRDCEVNVFGGPDEGQTPLQRVCLLKEKPSEKHLQVVKLLIEHGAKLLFEDETGRTPLFAASKNGFVDIVKILLEAISSLPERKRKRALNHKMMNGWTILMETAFHGHADVIRLLLEAGATVIETKDDHETALHIAAYNGHADVVKLLTANKDRFVVNARDKFGLTPLMMATQQKHMDIANILLEAGADVNLQSNNEERRTALMYAASLGCKEIVQLLWKYKPNVDIKDSRNKTVFDLARSPEVVHCLREQPITKPNIGINVSN